MSKTIRVHFSFFGSEMILFAFLLLNFLGIPPPFCDTDGNISSGTSSEIAKIFEWQLAKLLFLLTPNPWDLDLSRSEMLKQLFEPSMMCVDAFKKLMRVWRMNMLDLS